jgi:hypothetical protein
LQLSFSGELLETVALHNDAITLDRNLAAFDRLIVAMGTPAETDRIARERGAAKQEWKGFLWNGVGHEHIVEFLSGYTTHPRARKVNSALLAEFIDSMARSGELTKWTVALIGGGEGAPRALPGGRTLDHALQRKAEKGVEDRYSIGRLLSPRDEAIDLGEAAWKAALDSTVKAWKPDPGRQAGGEKPSPPEIPNGPAIRRVRGRGAEGVAAAPERGLLLLYLLDPQKSEGPFADRVDPVVAFGMSFPASDAGVKVEYKVDHLLYEMEYGPAE